MPGCSAYGCSNSAAKGFVMKYFPRDPERKKLWEVKVKRENWHPSNHSVICEVHFEANMWEKLRVDGKKKLKCNAIPTLFSFVPPPVHRKEVKDRSNISTKLTRKRKIVDKEPIGTEIVTSPTSFDANKSSDTEVSESSLDDAQKLDKSKLQEKLQIYNRRFGILLRKNKVYKNNIRKYKKKVNILEGEIRNLKNVDGQHENTRMLRSILNYDQISALKRRSTKGMKWSNVTVKKALKLKFSCGNSGYEELINQNIPLPSVRTLQRRLQNLKFESGILNEVFEFLKIKVDSFKNVHEKDCVIVLDEMAITPSRVYDASTSLYVGDITLPDHSGLATHALVIMLGGISTRWKQTVAYYFSGDSVNGSVYEDILLQIIKKSEDLGLSIVSVTSDMGSSNQALWKNWNITAGRYSRISNSIPHPLDTSRKIFVLADVPHLFKNIKNMFVTNKTIVIPNSIQHKYHLPTNLINIEHVKELINYQRNLDIKLAPKLKEEDIEPSHYQKMKVSKSTHVISHEVSSALKFLSQELNKQEYLTTAWFIDNVAKWFALTTSRHPTVALSKLKMDVYKDTIDFLNDFIELFQSIEVGQKKYWKPSQTGVLITTKSLLDLQHVFLEDKEYIFLLTSRFTQDCLENVFSAVRAKQLIPTALQFKNNLKIICVSQYLKDVSKGSYEQDDREFLSDFLDVLNNKHVEKVYSQVVLPENFVINDVILNNSEINSLYNISGYIVTSIQKSSATCDLCITSVGSKTFKKSEYSRLVKLKCYKRNSLFFCNYNTFVIFLKMEKIFRQYNLILNLKNVNIRDFFIEKFKTITINHVLQCHNLQHKIITRFLNFRLKIASKKNENKSNIYGSKSMRK